MGLHEEITNRIVEDLQEGFGVEKQAYRRIVARVALYEGGTERLAILFGVSSGLVSQWIQGLAPIPPDMFLRCVDYLLDHQFPSDAATPSAAKDSDASPARVRVSAVFMDRLRDGQANTRGHLTRLATFA